MYLNGYRRTWIYIKWKEDVDLYPLIIHTKKQYFYETKFPIVVKILIIWKLQQCIYHNESETKLVPELFKKNKN